MPRLRLPALALALLGATAASAQVPAEGIVWERDEPARKIHLSNEHGRHMMYDWSARQELRTSAGLCATYTFEPATETETFRLHGRNSNRAEIRLLNEYEFGARQFEGYVTLHGAVEDQCVMQIWGSAAGATQLMLRAYAADGGTLAVTCGSAPRTRLLTGAFGREIKVNIVHRQEDAGNRILVHLDDRLVAEFPDDEKAVNNYNANYHKYGVYGTVRPGHEDAAVSWRRVRHFRAAGGAHPRRAVQTIRFEPPPPPRAGDPEFDLAATSSSGLPLRYRSSDPRVVEVSDAGRARPVGPGTALLLAFHEGNPAFHPASEVREFLVRPRE